VTFAADIKQYDNDMKKQMYGEISKASLYATHYTVQK
jgi:hypothetical protein